MSLSEDPKRFPRWYVAYVGLLEASWAKRRRRDRFLRVAALGYAGLCVVGIVAAVFAIPAIGLLAAFLVFVNSLGLGQALLALWELRRSPGS